MKITLERIIIIGLAFILIILLLKDCSRPSEQREADRKEQYETEVAILKAEKTSIQARQDTLVKKVVLRSRKDSVQIALQNARIKALQTKLTNQRPKVIEKIQADTAVLSYVNTLEEIVTEIQVQNDTLKSQIQFQRKINEDLILLEAVEDRVEADLTLQTSVRIADLERSAKKRERKSRLAKVLIPIVAAGAFLLGATL